MTVAESARTALDAHTGLLEFLRHPPAEWVGHLDSYMAGGRQVVRQKRRSGYEGLTPDEQLVLRGWEHYTWPAETGADLARLLAEPLREAPTYEVTAEITEAVTGMYRATAGGEPVLRETEMPSPAGFAWLDEPVTFTDFYGNVNTVRALSWGPVLFRPPGTEPAEVARG